VDSAAVPIGKAFSKRWKTKPGGCGNAFDLAGFKYDEQFTAINFRIFRLYRICHGVALRFTFSFCYLIYLALLKKKQKLRRKK